MTAPALTWTPHPLLPPLAAEEVAALCATEAGAAQVLEYHAAREQRIRLAGEEGDPLRYGFELPHWAEADDLLAENHLLYVSGGKRASKSHWAAKRIVDAAVHIGRGIIWCFQDSEATSIATQQKLIWLHLPPPIRALNGKRHPVYKINYTQANGFTDRKLVLPNRTEIYFLTYNQESSEYQGWELGFPAVELQPALEERQRQGGELPRLFNMGVWADENLTLSWFDTIKLRLATRGAKMIWTYSPLVGITRTIKEFLGALRVVKSLPSALLPDRVNVPGCPPGHMPFIGQPTTPRSAVMYFHTALNPFGGYEYVKDQCAGRDAAYVMRQAYGWCEDTQSRALPLFSGVNVIEPEALPAAGTNYHLVDPAGNRNWSSIWVRVAPGNPADFYIYRDWPDLARFGEWAVASDRVDHPDGDPGPAQRSLGYGVVEYKRLFLAEELILPAGTAKAEAEARARQEADPYRRRRILEALEALEGDVLEESVVEEIHERYIDPRAGKAMKQAERGGTCLQWELDKENRDEQGRILAPKLFFRLASGVEIRDGLIALNTLLWWDTKQPLVPILNAPRLFVVRTAAQVIWAAETYTAEGGEDGACKDFADLLRYMATSNLRFITAGGRVRTSGGGSYGRPGKGEP
jgi:hypothetical protein